MYIFKTILNVCVIEFALTAEAICSLGFLLHK